jgi:hypothetical protein
MVKRGILMFPSSTTFWILSKGFPVWLAVLDCSFVEKITLMGAPMAQAFQESMLVRARV